MGSDFSDCLSESEFDYGVDGYMFEPTQPDYDNAGHVSRVGDNNEVGGILHSLNNDSSLRLDRLW